MGYKPDVSALKIHAPQLRVDYERYNPNHDEATHGRKSLGDLDYSPLNTCNVGIFLYGRACVNGWIHLWL